MDNTAHAPRIFVLAGTNGAGKSSIGGAIIRARGGQYFNPDEAAARIRAAQPHLSATQANSAAWHEGKRLLQYAIAHRQNYNFETTLGGKSLPGLLKLAAEQGFELRIWYVGLASPEHHLARVKARVRKGGHDIPEADIRRRFDQSRLQLVELLPHLCELKVFDNSGDADPHQGQAPKPRLLLHWQRPGGADQPASAGRVLVPVGAAALAETPDWAKPVVMAAFKAQVRPEAAVAGPAKGGDGKPGPGAKAVQKAAQKAVQNARDKAPNKAKDKVAQDKAGDKVSDKASAKPGSKTRDTQGEQGKGLAVVKPQGSAGARPGRNRPAR